MFRVKHSKKISVQIFRFFLPPPKIGGLTVQWARKNKCGCSKDTCAKAAEGGHLEILQWAIKNGCENLNILSSAAYSGNLEILDWAYNRVCEIAASLGHFYVLKFASEMGCKLNVNVCIKAAELGHLGILKWLTENGCKLSGEVCVNATRSGHLKVLKFVVERVCKWDKEHCLKLADLFGWEDVFRWLKSLP